MSHSDYERAAQEYDRAGWYGVAALILGASVATIGVQLVLMLSIAWGYSQATIYNRPTTHSWWWTPAWCVPEILALACLLGVSFARLRPFMQRRWGRILAVVFFSAFTVVPLFAATGGEMIRGAIPGIGW